MEVVIYVGTWTVCPPDTPLRDLVDRCRVWESHAELAVRNVNKPNLTYPAYTVKPMEEDPDIVRAVSVDKSAGQWRTRVK